MAQCAYECKSCGHVVYIDAILTTCPECGDGGLVIHFDEVY